MQRRTATITVLALLLGSLAAPAAARQPADLASLVDSALAAKIHAAEQAQGLLAAPGQSDEKLAERQARLDARIAKWAEKWPDGKPGLGEGSERSIEVHKMLADGCNPGKGQGKKLGHLREDHKFAACASSDTEGYQGPPGQDPFKAKGADDDADD